MLSYSSLKKKKKKLLSKLHFSKLFLLLQTDFELRSGRMMLAIKTKNYLRPCLDGKRSNFCLKSLKTFQVETRSTWKMRMQCSFQRTFPLSFRRLEIIPPPSSSKISIQINISLSWTSSFKRRKKEKRKENEVPARKLNAIGSVCVYLLFIREFLLSYESRFCFSKSCSSRTTSDLTFLCVSSGDTLPE